MREEVKVNVRFRDEQGNILKAYPQSSPEKVLKDFSLSLGLLGLLIVILGHFLGIPIDFNPLGW